MRIAVLGTGPVGQTVATRLAELGHDVTIGARPLWLRIVGAVQDPMFNITVVR
jgi:predicted dinucleotide-binding enzyme